LVSPKDIVFSHEDQRVRKQSSRGKGETLWQQEVRNPSKSKGMKHLGQVFDAWVIVMCEILI
jgi:hypothetical protein